jgi:hypothetical protein
VIYVALVLYLVGSGLMFAFMRATDGGEDLGPPPLLVGSVLWPIWTVALAILYLVIRREDQKRS